MARVIPSQVVNLIDELFPLVREELKQKKSLFTPSRSDAPKLVGMMDLIEHIPAELINA